MKRLQVKKYQDNDDSVWIDRDNLKAEMDSWQMTEMILPTGRSFVISLEPLPNRLQNLIHPG